MSAETDFHTLLRTNAGVAAVVGTRIAFNAVPQGAQLPYIAITAQHEPEHGLDNTLLADRVTFTVQCWAANPAAADATADAALAALAAAGVVHTLRVAGYDEQLDLDATVLTVPWWA